MICMYDVIILPGPNVNWTAVEIRAWSSNYILLFYLDVIPNPCTTSDTDLANLSSVIGPDIISEVCRYRFRHLL